MTAAIAAEWLKVRTIRTVFWMLLALVSLTLLIVIVGGVAEKAATLSASKDQLDLLTGSSAVAMIIALIVGVILSTGEFRHQTITPTLLAIPNRAVVTVAKGVAGAFFGAVLVAVAQLLSAVAVPIILTSRGIDISLDASDTATKIAQFVAVAAIWGALGSAVGLLVRNQTAAVIGAFVWVFLIEHLIVALLESSAIDSSAGKYFPFRATIAIFGDADPEEHLLSAWGGLLALGCWLAALTALAGFLLARRDVN